LDRCWCLPLCSYDLIWVHFFCLSRVWILKTLMLGAFASLDLIISCPPAWLLLMCPSIHCLFGVVWLSIGLYC
jgi:hypothetical protein